MRLTTHRVPGFTTSATARLIGRVADHPKALGVSGLARLYIETGPESKGGVHEVLAEGAVADFCLRHAEVGAMVQLQGVLRSDAEQREDGLWRWRSTVFADRMRRLPDGSEITPFNEVVVQGYACTDIRVCRPFADQVHPFWLEAVERAYVEVDGADGEEHILVALSEHLGAEVKHRVVVDTPLIIRGALISGANRDAAGRSWRCSAVDARAIERRGGVAGLPPLGLMEGPGCSATEIELLWATSPSGPRQEQA